MDAYSTAIERMMKRLYDSLAESARRRYAAIEATKLGHGGVEYIAQVLQCDPKSIRRGLAELEGTENLETDRIRKEGVDEKKNRPESRGRGKLLGGAPGPHRRRSHAHEREMDELVASWDRPPSYGDGHSG